MTEQAAFNVNTVLDSCESDEVRIEMDNLSGQVPSPGNPAGEQVDERIPKPGALPDVRETEMPPEVERFETVPLKRPYAWGHWTIPYQYPMVQEDPWETLKSRMDKYDAEMCKAWNGELDTILTFTGMFSAAVTAFCIDSFRSLSQDPADTTNVFLIALSQQLANSSSPVAAFSMVDGFAARTHDVYTNALYFVSLTLALSVSSMCILGKQWIREFEKDVSISASAAVRVRQVRFDSLEVWKVPEIMAVLPVILLAALLLFFTGLLIQLWNASEHTTAIAVSIVVALITLIVIVTTIVPALWSMQPRRTAFTPFRSPQAWIVFVVYRRLQQWYHGILHVYAETPISPASWAAFDMHFLEVEAKEWFDNEINSVHRSLQWAYSVLRNSSAAEKAVYWCFQIQFRPEDLIKSERDLSRYVLSGDKEDRSFTNPYRLCYDCSERVDGQQGIDSVVGRYQAESYGLPITRYNMERNPNNGMALFTVMGGCSGLRSLVITHKRTLWIHKIQDQLALLLEATFQLRPLSRSSKWTDIIYFLLVARRESSSPLSRQITYNIINQQFPEWIREHMSPSLLYDIEDAICDFTHLSWEDGIMLFTCLDKIMVEICTEPGGIEGLDEECVEMWKELRISFINKVREGDYINSPPAPVNLRLPDGHFDAVHGPLRSFPPTLTLDSIAQTESYRPEQQLDSQDPMARNQARDLE